MNIITKEVKEMILVEKNPFSSIFFDMIKKKEKFHNVEFLSKDVSDICSSILKKDIIIVDPPRKGLEKTLLLSLAEKNKGCLVYISCFFYSFKRDSDFLILHGWKLKKIDGFLFFPGTNHIEILGFFEKK